MHNDILFLMTNDVSGVQKLIMSLHLLITELHGISVSLEAHSYSAGPEIHYFYGT
jgi:hypothetical protein